MTPVAASDRLVASPSAGRLVRILGDVGRSTREAFARVAFRGELGPAPEAAVGRRTGTRA